MMEDDYVRPTREEQDEMKREERKSKEVDFSKFFPLGIASVFGVISLVLISKLARSGLSQGTEFGGLLLTLTLCGCIVSIVAYFGLRSADRDPDQVQRAVMADFEQFEKNVKRDIFRTIRKQQLDRYAPKELVIAEVQRRVDDALVSTIDESLQRRLADGAKSVDVIAYIDDVQSRVTLMLDGPAGRAEKRSTRLMLGAIAVGVAGLVIAVIRVLSLGDYSQTLLVLSKQLGSKSVWPYVIALSTPWVTLVALVEFSALILLKLSNQFSALQRQYTELLVDVMDRFLGLKAVVRFGDSEQIVGAATLLMKSVGHVEGKQDGIDDSLSAVTKATENMVAVVKQFAGKGNKAAE